MVPCSSLYAVRLLVPLNLTPKQAVFDKRIIYIEGYLLVLPEGGTNTGF